MSGGAVHYEIKANVIREDSTKPYETSKIDSLLNEFKTFLREQDIKDKETLLKLGIDYIEKIETKEEGK